MMVDYEACGNAKRAMMMSANGLQRAQCSLWHRLKTVAE